MAKSDVVLVNAFTDSDNDGLTDEQEKEYNTNKNKADTDGDGLTDFQEVKLYLTDPNKKDTDGDRLTDGQEITVTGTNPLKKDTDGNGVTDDLEDLDHDTLTTYEEIQIGTNPQLVDSDFDELKDNEEQKLKTNPTNEDTDNDGLTDGNEISYKTDPLNPDSNGNGIKDGDEKYETIIETDSSDKDTNAYPTLKMTLKGEDLGKVSISNVEEATPYLNNKYTAGYLAAPYEFRTDAQFGTATIEFNLDSSIVNDPNIEPAIYYFNPKTQLLELLENQKLDRKNGTISADVNHFSTYIVLNKKKVDEVWDTKMLAPHTGNLENVQLAITFALDSSGSMEDNDPNDIRKTTAKEFVDKLDDNDKAAIVDFDSYAEVLCPLTNNKEDLKDCIDEIDSWGGTDISEAMRASIDELSKSDSSAVKYIILLTDGEGYYDDALTEEAKSKGIVVYTIGLGDSIDEELLKKIAEETGGEYFYAETAEDLIDRFNETSEETIELASDSDQDGLSDYHEKHGLRIFDNVIYTDPNKADSDGDGIKDGDEVQYVALNDEKGYFKLISNPLEKDSDFDGIEDQRDPEPLRYNITDRTLALAAKLSYTNLSSNVGKTVSVLKNNSLKELNNWKIVHSNHSGLFDAFFRSALFQGLPISDEGLGSVGIKLSRTGEPDTVIYAVRGTELLEDFLNDFVTSDLLGYLLLFTPQSDDAFYEYVKLVTEEPNAKFYLAGHSLGGRVVQDVFYSTEKSNDSIFKTDINSPIRAATFNALGYNYLMYKLLDNDVLDTIKPRLINYYYKNDLVGEFLGKYRIGTDINPWVAKDSNGNATDGLKIFGTDYILGAVHSINLWTNDNRLQYPNISYID